MSSPHSTKTPSPAEVTRAPVFTLALSEDFDTLPYLSLGMVTAYLRYHDDESLARNYLIEPIRIGGVEGHSLEEALRGIADAGPCLCLLSSYVWNHHVNLAAAAEIKQLNPQAVIIFGGPEVPKYSGETEVFLEANGAIDIAVLGEGEVACAEILQQLAQGSFSLASLAEVAGIVYRSAEGIHRTGERQRLVDINQLPSPYLTGEFEPWFHDFNSAILETNRGCPYGCTYCDWGSATLQKVSKFEIDRVVAELEIIAAQRSLNIFIADANFGMLEQDIAIAQALVETKARTGFPRRLFTNFAKNGGRRLMAVIKILHEGGLLETGIIALQTTDDHVLKTIRRDNIKTASYEKLMAYFNSENIPMASDIMIGLPGQTVDSLQQDLQFCFDWKVSANGNYTSMMPNAPMAEKSYREALEIVADAEGLIASTASFSKEDMAYMKSFYLVYQFHVSLGILKYYLYYLQLEHDVPALALLRHWFDAVLAGDVRLPLSIRVYEEIFDMENRTGNMAMMSWTEEANFLFDAFEDYCDEFHRFAVEEYGLSVPHSAYTCLRDAQATIMPRPGRSYPYLSDLPHNIILYFRQLKRVSNVAELAGVLRPLHKFRPGKIRANPMTNKVESVNFIKFDAHADGWELRSPLRFYKAYLA